jgi:hypothetical protein
MTDMRRAPAFAAGLRSVLIVTCAVDRDREPNTIEHRASMFSQQSARSGATPFRAAIPAGLVCVESEIT